MIKKKITFGYNKVNLNQGTLSYKIKITTYYFLFIPILVLQDCYDIKSNF